MAAIAIISCTAIISCLVTAPAAANDSSAGLKNGSLVLLGNDALALRAETLKISLKQIDVTYRFFNRTDAPVTTIVAFPLPTIPPPISEKIVLPSKDPVNTFGFSASVDGHPIAVKVEQRAFAMDGLDQTAVLRRLGIPLVPRLLATYQALDRLPRRQAKWNELIKLRLAVEDSEHTPGAKVYLAPRWKLKTTYYWRQTFPARREVVVEHRYKPSVGITVGTSLDMDLRYPDQAATDEEQKDYLAKYRRKYCVPNSLIEALFQARKQDQNADETVDFWERRIDYILKTAANWAGPIGDFRLVVDTGNPGNFVSACEDLVKTGPTQFVFEKKNFTPTRDLSILILQRR